MAANALAGGITAAHIAGCFPDDGETDILLDIDYFRDEMLPLLTAERDVIRNRGLTHSINCNNYDNVYVTSDIHADYRKLLQTLVDNNLITLPDGFPVDDLFTDRIYDSTLITDTLWNNPRTCLIILGDIVDGKRRGDMQVEDPLGLFEMLIHMFLFNLRRRALENNSLVAFTLGNHDYHSIITPLDPRRNDEHGRPIGWFDRYVHDTARALYHDDQDVRMRALLPFYNVYPLFFVSIQCPQKAGREEMVGIHAGFHANNGDYLIEPIREIQRTTDALTRGQSLNNLPKEVLGVIADAETSNGGLWSRLYNEYNICETLEDLAPKLFVVGHCVTIYDESAIENGQVRHSVTKYENPGYETCLGHGDQSNPDAAAGKRGCVVLSCNNKLAHVDVGMSTSFYTAGAWATFNRTSDKEMLHLSHNPGLSIEDRYYNIVRRASRAVNTEMFREVRPAAAANNGPAANNGAAGANNNAQANGAAGNNGTVAVINNRPKTKRGKCCTIMGGRKSQRRSCRRKMSRHKRNMRRRRNTRRN